VWIRKNKKQASVCHENEQTKHLSSFVNFTHTFKKKDDDELNQEISQLDPLTVRRNLKDARQEVNRLNFSRKRQSIQHQRQLLNLADRRPTIELRQYDVDDPTVALANRKSYGGHFKDFTNRHYDLLKVDKDARISAADRLRDEEEERARRKNVQQIKTMRWTAKTIDQLARAQSNLQSQKEREHESNRRMRRETRESSECFQTT